MAEIAVVNAKRQEVGTLSLPDTAFAYPYKRHLLYEAVRHFLACARAGTHKAKNRTEVSGGGKKPWKQKGTGRARQGSTRSPLWRHGGVVFGPKPRDFAKKTNRKTRQLALRKALSERLRAGDVLVVDDLKLPTSKTKDFISLLSALEVTGTALFVAKEGDKNLLLASRNVASVAVTTSDTLNTYDVLRPDKLVFTRGAFEQIEARLTKE